MIEPLVETRSYKQLARATTISPDALLAFEETEGPLQAIEIKKLLGRLISTDAAFEEEAAPHGAQGHLDYDENSLALVYADPAPAKNGWYRKVGASGSGSWLQFEKLSDQAAAEIGDLVDLSRAWAEGIEPGGTGTKSAKSYATEAEQARDVAVAAGGLPPFASQEAGEAATAAGDLFRVIDSAGLTTLYRRTPGGSDVIDGPYIGAEAVGFKDAGPTAIPRSIGDQVGEIHTSVRAYGAVGAGPVNDYPALQAAIDKAGVGGTVFFPKTDGNIYGTAGPLKFYSGQTWHGSGGPGLPQAVTKIRLINAVDDAMVLPIDPNVITEGVRFHGIDFEAGAHAPRTIWFYNTKLSTIEHCGIVNGAADGVGIDMDSHVDKHCYFNKIEQVRVYASPTTGKGIRFCRGANANQVIGGSVMSSYIGMSFETLSFGNSIIAVNMEENKRCHFYVDSPGNNFLGNRLEHAPVGFEITELGNFTYSANHQWTTSIITPYIDNSRLGTRLENLQGGPGTDATGILRFGSAEFRSIFNTLLSSVSYDPSLYSNSVNVLFNLFRSISTTGTKQFNIYRGDGTNQRAFGIDATTGDIARANATGGQTRQFILRPSPPATCAQGDICTIQSPALGAAAAYIGVAANTWGLFAQAGVAKNVTANRPVLAVRDAGALYLDTTLAAAGKPIWWTGTAWVDATGAVV